MGLQQIDGHWQRHHSVCESSSECRCRPKSPHSEKLSEAVPRVWKTNWTGLRTVNLSHSSLKIREMNVIGLPTCLCVWYWSNNCGKSDGNGYNCYLYIEEEHLSNSEITPTSSFGRTQIIILECAILILWLILRNADSVKEDICYMYMSVGRPIQQEAQRCYALNSRRPTTGLRTVPKGVLLTKHKILSVFHRTRQLLRGTMKNRR